MSNLFASWPAGSSTSACAFHDYAHAVRLDDGNWRLCGDKFSFRYNINNLIGKARFPARSQDSDSGTPRSGGECEGSGKFTRRADDTAETVSNRLMAYYRDTAPLTGYYFCKGNLHSVDGMAPIEQVAQDIGKILSSAKKAR